MTPPMIDFASLPKEFSLRLVLIRHGEPEQKVKGRCYGSLDVNLAESGRKQIQAKLASISNLIAQVLYVSPLKRARESAAVISESGLIFISNYSVVQSFGFPSTRTTLIQMCDRKRLKS